jgi:hypothetical protein
MTDKLKNRVSVYSSYDELDFIDRADLPVELGGKVNTADCIGKFMKNLFDTN